MIQNIGRKYEAKPLSTQDSLSIIFGKPYNVLKNNVEPESVFNFCVGGAIGCILYIRNCSKKPDFCGLKVLGSTVITGLTFDFMISNLQKAKSFLSGLVHKDSKKSILETIEKDEVAKLMCEFVSFCASVLSAGSVFILAPMVVADCTGLFNADSPISQKVFGWMLRDLSTFVIIKFLTCFFKALPYIAKKLQDSDAHNDSDVCIAGAHGVTAQAQCDLGQDQSGLNDEGNYDDHHNYHQCFMHVEHHGVQGFDDCYVA